MLIKLIMINDQIELNFVSDGQFVLNERIMNEIELIELILDLNQVIRGLFRKYKFSRISSNTETLDTRMCISRSTLTPVLGASSFDVH